MADTHAEIMKQLRRGDLASAYHALSVDPLRSLSPELSHLYGYTLFRLGKPDDAILEFGAAISMSPFFVDAIINRSFAYIAIKRWDDAIADAEAAIEIDDSRSIAWHHRGLAFVGIGELDEAFASFRQALLIDDTMAEARFSLASALTYSGDFDEALTQVEKCQQTFGSQALFHSLKGLLLLWSGKLKESVASFDAAIETAPTSVNYFLRGNANRALQRLDRAVADYTSAIGIDYGFELARTARREAIEELHSII